MASRPAEEKYGYEDNRFEKAVDAHFHCSICYNVLKEPRMCRDNEHIFCRGCITEHLTVNSHACPECNEALTVETLRQAPRLVRNYLSELKINCSYSSRGCPKYTRLEELDSHVENCGFAPAKCSNKECSMEINKRELIHHESMVCEYRKVKCHSCSKLEKDMEDMKTKMALKEDVDQLKAMMFQVFEKLTFLENTIQISSAINHASNTSMEDILVAGGKDRIGKHLKSVERFSWKSNVWDIVPPMDNGRAGAISFVYENQLFVAGGCDSDVIEVMELNQNELKWKEFAATLPHNCKRLFSVVYQNRAIIFCTSEDFDSMDTCVELSLAEPYTCRERCTVPEPVRKGYRLVAFEHKVLIFGGKNGDRILNNVLEFDLTTNKFKDMPPLPCALHEMATVRWGDQAVLIGGLNENGYTNKVYMYNSKSGQTTKLPPMTEERAGCCAVITGNTIVVMGGKGRKTYRLSSVEAFTLGGYSWRRLPAMNDIRSLPAAVVLPTKNAP